MELGGRKSDLSRRDLVTTTATADDEEESFGPGTLGAAFGRLPQSWDFEADVVVICPSNPVVSIGPILALPEVRDTLVAHPRVLAVSPIVGGKPIKGPADRLMAAIGAEVSAAG